MANQQYQNRSGAYVREVHVHYHQASASQQPQERQSRQPSPEELETIEKWRSLTAISFVTIFSLFFPPFVLIYGVWWLVYRRKKPTAIITPAPVPAQQAAANNPLGLGGPAARQALSSAKKQSLATVAHKALIQPRKRLTAPFKRLPRP
jgi:hypothetical protein